MHESMENIASGATSRVAPLVGDFMDKYALDESMLEALTTFASDAYCIGVTVGASEVAAQLQEQGMSFKLDMQVSNVPGYPSTSED